MIDIMTHIERLKKVTYGAKYTYKISQNNNYFVNNSLKIDKR